MSESKHFTNDHEGMIMLHIVLSASLLSQASSQSPDGQDFSLAVTIPGVPGMFQFSCYQWQWSTIVFKLLGEDYPIFSDSPETSFLCDGRVPGYYTDQEVEI